MQSERGYDHLVRMTGLARGLEMGGFYNAAKLLWAAAYAQELRASSERGVPAGSDALASELGAVIGELRASGAQADLIAALERGQTAVRKDASIPVSDIPEVHVCRTCGEIVLGPAPEACPNCGAWELTFKTFLAVYYLEPLPPDQALAALSSAPGLVEALVGGLIEQQMTVRPREGEWGVGEVLMHLLTSQELLAGRVTRMLAEDNPSLKAQTASEMARAEVLRPSEVFQKFRTSRLKTVAELKAASPVGWWRTGVHEEFGRVTVLEQASYFAKHDHNHLTQIRQILKAIG
jgi:hypothetical protein